MCARRLRHTPRTWTGLWRLARGWLSCSRVSGPQPGHSAGQLALPRHPPCLHLGSHCKAYPYPLVHQVSWCRHLCHFSGTSLRPPVPLQCHVFALGLFPGARTAEDQAQLVIQQLEQLQERVRLTISGVARAQWKLLHAVGTESAEPSPPASLETHLDLEGPPSKHPGLKDQMQVFVVPWPSPGRSPHTAPCPVKKLQSSAPGSRGGRE
jgi:hypothetical protein